MKQRKHLILVSAILLTLVGIVAAKYSRIFDTFNKEHLIRTAFHTDLTPYVAKEKANYSDGIGG